MAEDGHCPGQRQESQARAKKERSFFFYKVERSRADQAVVKTDNVAEGVKLYKTAVSVVLALGGANVLDNLSAQHQPAGNILHAGSLLWLGCELEGHDHVHAPHRPGGTEPVGRHHDIGSASAHISKAEAILGGRLYHLL